MHKKSPIAARRQRLPIQSTTSPATVERKLGPVEIIEIDEIEQGSQEWFQIRLGIPTASNFSIVMASGRDGDESKTRAQYMRVLAGEILTGRPGEGKIVTAAMQQIPEALLQRLEPGGVLIAPVGPHQGVQTLIRMVRTDAGLETRELVDVRFVPALPGIAREL